MSRRKQAAHHEETEADDGATADGPTADGPMDDGPTPDGPSGDGFRRSESTGSLQVVPLGPTPRCEPDPAR